MSKERLVELLTEAHNEQRYLTSDKSINAIADFLLANEVIVPHFKIGDKVYFSHIGDRNNEPSCINRIETLIEKRNTTIVKETYYYCNTGDIFTNRHIGKIAFRTREEAEAKLKESERGV